MVMAGQLGVSISEMMDTWHTGSTVEHKSKFAGILMQATVLTIWNLVLQGMLKVQSDLSNPMGTTLLAFPYAHFHKSIRNEALAYAIAADKFHPYAQKGLPKTATPIYQQYDTHDLVQNPMQFDSVTQSTSPTPPPRPGNRHPSPPPTASDQDTGSVLLKMLEETSSGYDSLPDFTASAHEDSSDVHGDST